MRKLEIAAQTVFADLLEKSRDAMFEEDFPENGSFVKMNVSGRQYWYYKGVQPNAKVSANDTRSDKRSMKYVGPVSDPKIDQQVQEFNRAKVGHRERRKSVSALVSMGLPRSESFSGDLVESLWRAGAFRLRATLIGTTAYQTYSGLVGVLLPNANMRTEDVDVAQFHSISMLVDDSMPPMLDTIRAVDPSFREIPHQADGRATCTYVNAGGYKLEFLTPNASKEEYQDKPARMNALGGASAQPLRFLDFLIHDPVHSVVLHRAGIPVLVPAPERYAVHKLIVAADRRADAHGLTKSRKDVLQAGSLIQALEIVSRAEDVGNSWIEAWERGPGWQKRLAEGASRLEGNAFESLANAVGAACREDGLDPTDYGFEGTSPKP